MWIILKYKIYIIFNKAPMAKSHAGRWCRIIIINKIEKDFVESGPVPVSRTRNGISFNNNPLLLYAFVLCIVWMHLRACRYVWWSSGNMKIFQVKQLNAHMHTQWQRKNSICTWLVQRLLALLSNLIEHFRMCLFLPHCILLYV